MRMGYFDASSDNCLNWNLNPPLYFGFTKFMFGWYRFANSGSKYFAISNISLV